MSTTSRRPGPAAPAAPAARMQLTEEQAEQQLNQLVSEIRTLEAYYNEIVARIQAASAGLSDARAAIQALDALAANQNGEFLMPIGGGVLLPLNNVETKRLVVSIGAGVAVERDVDSTRAFLQTREKEVEKAYSALEQQRREVGSRLEAARSVLQQVTGQE